jgi:hypothetical protein
MTALHLYDLADEAVALDDLLAMDDGEWTDEADALATELAGKLATKADAFGGYVRTLEAQDEAIAAEIARLTARRRAIVNRTAKLKQYGLLALQRMERPKVAGDLFTLAVQLNPPSVTLTVGVDALPAQYVRTIPEQREPDKAAIRDALKRGETIDGAMLTITQSLRIR